MASYKLVAADPWRRSGVTQEVLEGLVALGLLRPCTDAAKPEWLVPAEEHEALAPPEGYVVSFTSFHERGFGAPPSRFMRALPHYYGVELHNLTPNSISQAAIFVTLCEGFLGIPPHWDLWRYYLKADLSTVSVEKKVRKPLRAGGCAISVKRVDEYIPAKLLSSHSGWQAGWFYLRNDDNLLPAYTGKVVEERPFY